MTDYKSGFTFGLSGTTGYDSQGTYSGALHCGLSSIASLRDNNCVLFTLSDLDCLEAIANSANEK